MRDIKKNTTLAIASLVILFSSCSKDDDNGSSLNGVPSGEIVAVEERDEALTGYSDLKDSQETQKWWTHVTTVVDYSSDDCGSDVEYEEMGYFAFYPDGSYYYKSSVSGYAYAVGSWEWTDSSKEEIYVSNSSGSGDFTITYLNDENVVYGSYQSASGCSATTYEQFNSPFYE